MGEQEQIIAARLKYLRAKNGLKVSEILKILEVPKSTYTSWELGRRKPRYESLVKLADLYNTTIDYMIGQSDVEEKQETDLSYLLNSGTLVYNGKVISKYEPTELKEIFDYILKKSKQ